MPRLARARAASAARRPCPPRHPGGERAGRRAARLNKGAGHSQPERGGLFGGRTPPPLPPKRRAAAATRAAAAVAAAPLTARYMHAPPTPRERAARGERTHRTGPSGA